nr:MAG TPA: hypothetical protein [Caudoviricetes sp.]
MYTRFKTQQLVVSLLPVVARMRGLAAGAFFT